MSATTVRSSTYNQCQSLFLNSSRFSNFVAGDLGLS